MTLEEIVRYPLEWTKGKGERSDVAISSRIRLARNIAAYRFPVRCDAGELKEVADAISKALTTSPMLKRSKYVAIDDLSPLARQVLVEDHLISPEFAKGGVGRMVALDERGLVSIMVNEEEHLRIQVIMGGLNLQEVWRIAQAIDEELEALGYAFDERLGFLTSCPTNVGTGMRASVMVHIPALEQMRSCGSLIRECNRLGLTVRGTYGEGTEAEGALYQISNQVTLGLSEEELIEKVSSVVAQVADQEEAARQELLRRQGVKLEDEMWRSWGALRYARLVSSREALKHLSLVKMGSDLGITPHLDAEEWNSLILNIQPAHVEAFAGRALSPEERDVARGNFLRGRLKMINEE